MRIEDTQQILKRMNSLERRVDRLARREGMSVTDPGVALPLTMGLIQALPALRGFWPGSVQASPTSGNYNLVDVSGNRQHFIHNNNPLLDFDTTRLFPYVDFNGSDEWYSIADTNHWDILGTEVGVASARRGLMAAAWVYFDNTASATEFILSKRESTTQLSYWLGRTSTGEARFSISSDGTNSYGVSSVATIPSAGWNLILGRFEPSAESAVYLNGTWAVNTTSIPASIYNGTADLFMAGRDDAATPGQDLMDGRIALAFVCAAHVPDAAIKRIWDIGRHIFGV